MDTPTCERLFWCRRRRTNRPLPTAANIPTTAMPAPTSHPPPALKAMTKVLASARTVTRARAARTAPVKAIINREDTPRRAYFIAPPLSPAKTFSLQRAVTSRLTDAFGPKKVLLAVQKCPFGQEEAWTYPPTHPRGPQDQPICP